MIKMIQKLKNKKGFTLVELIVVIAIIAILTAVIVPLIARYSAQAQYTTLQDAAGTISNSANNAMSDGNQVSAINISEIKGYKKGNTLTIELGNAKCQSKADGSADTVGKVSSTDPTKGEARAAERLVTALATTLPDGCAFFIAVNQSAVAGVIYTNSVTGESSDVPADASASGAANKIYIVEGFDNAYEFNSAAVGISGKYVTMAEKKTTTS